MEELKYLYCVGDRLKRPSYGSDASALARVTTSAKAKACGPSDMGRELIVLHYIELYHAQYNILPALYNTVCRPGHKLKLKGASSQLHLQSKAIDAKP